ncbi:CYTH and CHAD domain-containing protein [Rothia sp. 88186D007BW]
MATHHLEVEQKFELADVNREVPSVEWSFTRWSVREPVIEQLDATYYDTPSGNLGRHKVALRRRLGGYDQGWHIKFDAAGQRHEVTFDLLPQSSLMPAAVKKFVQVPALGEELEPRVSLQTHRTRTVIRDAAGQELAEICDDRVQALDFATGQERTWHEWEVELLGQTAQDPQLAEALFDAVATQLRALGALASKSPAKIARALGQDADFEARLAAKGKGHNKKTGKKSKKALPAGFPIVPGSAELLTSVLASHAQRLAQADLLVAAGVPDATHQGRIVARQLRSVLKYMALPYARSGCAPVLEEMMRGLKIYARQLETHRNGELMHPLAQQVVQSHPILGQGFAGMLGVVMEHQQEEAATQARRYLASADRLELQLALESLLTDVTLLLELPLNSENYVNKVAKRLRKNLVKQGKGAVATWPEEAADFAASVSYDEGLHDVRKAAKAVRYCLCATAAAGLPLTEPQTELLAQVKAVQADVGELTDELTMGDWLRGLHAQAEELRLDPFAIGYLLGRSETLAQQLRLGAFDALPSSVKKIKAIKLT